MHPVRGSRWTPVAIRKDVSLDLAVRIGRAPAYSPRKGLVHSAGHVTMATGKACRHRLTCDRRRFSTPR